MRLDSGMSLQQEVGWTRDMLRMTRYLAEIQDDAFVVCSLSNIQDELENWNSAFPDIEPTFYVGANPMTEVQECISQLGVKMTIKNKNDASALAQLQDSCSNVVYSSSTKLGSHIKAAVAAGVQIFFADTPQEMIKIKKVLPGARIIIELSIDENDNMESLDSGSGVRLSHLGSLLHEASRLNLEVVGLALNLDVSGCLDHEENLIKVKQGLKMAENALNIVKENQVHVKVLHVGEICRSTSSIPDNYANDINSILSKDVFRDIHVVGDASFSLVSSCLTLAARVTSSYISEHQSIKINESVFGAFSEHLTSSECCLAAPLPLGGGANRKGISNKLLDTEIKGNSGDDNDVVLPMGDIMLPILEEGDWLLFPRMGVMNLGEYLAPDSKIIGNKSFVSVKKPAATSGKKVGNLNFNSDTENSVNVDLDICNMNQNRNCNSDTGLRGEIDLRKTFIYED